ncbi:MAG TPA: amidohydrolase family protein [Acidimicrobiales bacterium]
MVERIVIRGGTVVDGTGAPERQADIAIEGDRIVEIGPSLEGDRELDASGQVVAPGFVDIHTHYDAQVFWDPALTPSCFHGVTTVVAGNCGFSVAPTRPEDRELVARTLEKVEDMDPASLAAGIPWDEFVTFPQYLDAIRHRGTVLNYSAYIGHTALRLYAMGDAASERTATDDERTAMAAIVREAMDAGAAGFATSFAVTHRGADGRPIPSRFADAEEIEVLCRAVADSGRGVIGVNGGEGLSFTDCYRLQPRVGIPFTYTALLTTPNAAHEKAVAIHREHRANGADVWPQVSCRPLTFSMHLVEPFTLNTSPVFAELMAGGLDARRAAYSDASWRQRVRDAWAAGQGLAPRWDTYEIMESVAHPELVGLKLSELAASASADPLDLLLELALSEPSLTTMRVKAILANDDVDGVAKLLAEPGCTLGLSDAGAHVGQLCDAPLPTDLLGGWVRDRGVITLEEAIRKLTSEPADLFGFSGRGRLVRGAFADVVVFDAASVAPGPVRRVRDFPADAERLTADQPSGMTHVLVNGVPIRLDGQSLAVDEPGRRPGRLVSPSAR